MASDPGQTPKIIVDDDWKSQAQAEKDRLTQEEAKKTAEAGARHGGAGGHGPEELPPADFPSLVGMLVTQALMYLGGVADRRTGQAIFDPEMARFYIDLLAVLEEKTKGNLSDAESKDLSGAVHELRLRFVELSQALARQPVQGKSAPGTPGVSGGAGGPGQPPMIRVG